MVVYILDIRGKPLMPTTRFGKVRRMLKNKEARVVNREPFTIQLLYKSNTYTQPINLGVDTGSKTIGISATTSNRELFCSEVKLRNNIVNLLAIRKEARRNRRYRKTRYRKARFNNRIRVNKKDWLPPSIRNKIDTHFTVIDKIIKILPITNIIVEVAYFDIRKMKNSNTHNKEYQIEERFKFWNVREYVLFRDNHICQCCNGESKDSDLNIHHIESRKTGGNSPNNLVTLCKTCHTNYHSGKINLHENIKRGASFTDATFMNIMSWNFYNKLKTIYPNVKMTFGYITKTTRVNNNLPKKHYIDARCISGNPLAKPLGICYKYKKVRCHNRQLHKFTPNKKGIRVNNQLAYRIFGYRLNDKVIYKGQVYFIHGRRRNGYFSLRDIDDNRIGNDNVYYKKLKLLEPTKSLLCQSMLI